MYRGAFPVITTRAGLKKVYFQEYGELPNLFEKIFNIESSTRGYEDFLKISGFGRMAQMAEGESVFYDRAVEGSRITAGHAMFGLGFQVSRLLWDDDMYGIMTKMSQALARSVRYEQEVRAWALINDAASGSTFTGFDSLALAHNTHTLLNSTGTFDNYLVADLSVSSLEAAVDMYATLVDDSNMYIPGEPEVLLVPSQNRWTASQLLESEYDPESANNAKNPLRDVGLSWFAVPFITDTDSWVLLSSKQYHDLSFYWRMKPETDDTEDFDTKGLKFSTVQRFLVHFNEWRGVVYSAGV
jgi:phage major head subunit gpT-like protein